MGLGVHKLLGDILTKDGTKLPPVDLYYLLGHAIGKSREFIIAHPEYKVRLRPRMCWKRLERRRLRGVPAAYLTGEKEFYGLTFEVNRHTLIPRPETELVVDEIIRRQPRSILDMGTGSGCIAVSVAYNLPECSVTATDISRKALAVAARNGMRLLNRKISFIRSDYFNALPTYRYEIIASNPPYVREGDVRHLSPEVASHEPYLALYGGREGLHAFRAILGSARDFLMPGGVLILEISPEVSSAVQGMVGRYGFHLDKLAQDLAGHDRMVVLSPQ
jgi:release factor glutamine methyltransferase